MTEKNARALISTLLSAYPRDAMNQETVALWTKFIEGFDFRQAKRAVMRIVATRYTFPTIASLREEIIEEQLAVPSAEEAYRQWSEHAVETPDRAIAVHPYVRMV